MLAPEDATTLSALFHLNSEPWLNAPAYAAAGELAHLTPLARRRAGLALPPPPETALQQMIRRRESCRAFGTASMAMETLSGLLAAAYGMAGSVQLNDGTSIARRSVPSAGALYPLDLYAVVQRVAGVADGLHRYDPAGHALEVAGNGPRLADFRNALLIYPFLEHCNVLLMWAAVFARCQTKYGPRGYRYILLEAGHSAQNVCLFSTQEGLGSLCVGGYFDAQVNQLLGLDSLHQGVVYGVAVGSRA